MPGLARHKWHHGTKDMAQRAPRHPWHHGTHGTHGTARHTSLSFLERCSRSLITPLRPPRLLRVVQQDAGDVESGAPEGFLPPRGPRITRGEGAPGALRTKPAGGRERNAQHKRAGNQTSQKDSTETSPKNSWGGAGRRRDALGILRPAPGPHEGPHEGQDPMRDPVRDPTHPPSPSPRGAGARTLQDGLESLLDVGGVQRRGLQEEQPVVLCKDSGPPP